MDAALSPSAAAPEVADFPAETRTLTVSPADYAAGGVKTLRFSLHNQESSILHIRVVAGIEWISLAPSEAALGPNERQTVIVRADIAKARTLLRSGGASTGPVRLTYQRLHPATKGIPALPPVTGEVFVILPAAACPACKRSLDAAIASGDSEVVPEFCPYCFERLRPCPICGTLNSWLARRCIRDEAHIVRALPDWGMLGANPAHTGAVEVRALPNLSRQWSYPSSPPLRRENALSWSAPAAAYGLVAAAAATPDGEAHIYAFDAKNGATLWDAYSLNAPVYPDRGGVAVAGGRLYAATIDGICMALDAQRGTRVWERKLPGRVFGAVTPTGGNGPLLVATMGEKSGQAAGTLYILDSVTGDILQRVVLPGPPDTAPTYADGRAFVHDDSGTLTVASVVDGSVLWTAAHTGTSFNAAPIVHAGKVYSATAAGGVVCRDAKDGTEEWGLAVTNAPFSGTPAADGTLIYLPADDGLHLISPAGRAVRRYPTRQPVRSAPVVAEGTLFFGSLDGAVYGTGAGRPLDKLYETIGAGSQIVAAPALADGRLFVAATNGVLYALAYDVPGREVGSGG